ncbi:MAG: hypothetical protein KQH63_11540 [Desulfobulbaceae bacterium]|nr:hypothetical protein [Desulfobulbaceae bacterium]
MPAFRLFLVLVLCCLTACAATKNQYPASNNAEQQDELLEFAEVSCMSFYFEKMNYDLQDIQAIAGGIVEMGSYPLSTYQEVALLTREYMPDLKSKQNIDVDLWKCFRLDSDEEFVEMLHELDEL